MEKLITELNGKLKTLTFRINKTTEVLAKNDRDAAERQKESIQHIAKAVCTLRETIEEKKFSKGEPEEEIAKWAAEIEEVLSRGDQCSNDLKGFITTIDREAKHVGEVLEHRQALKLEEEKLQLQQEATARAHAEQLEFERKRLELQQVQTKPSIHSSHGLGAIKLPKLVITQFDGTHKDWLRFWGQFETQIDKSTAPAITKFSYLKELVDLKVRNLIDGLPFTEEGYYKAKDLLCRRYGKTSDVVGTYVRNILELPTIKERDVKKIHEFHDTLLFNVASLQTLQSLHKLDAAARFTVDKIGVIKHELALMDDKWSEWDFLQFLEKLEQWTLNNPVSGGEQKPRNSHNPSPRKDKMFYTGSGSQPSKGCLYCDSTEHKAIHCDKIVTVEQRRRILSEKRLCFNCTGAKHRAADCKSKTTCQNCGAKHHTSICDKLNSAREQGMTANLVGKSSVIHPVVVVQINGYKFRALLDSGASHSYASSTAISLIKAKPKSTSLRQIAMLTGVETRTMQVFDVAIDSVKGDFQLKVNITKVEKRELLTLDNPNYKELVDNHAHLRGVEMDDVDTKELLPVHLIIGANDFAKIRTGERLRVGRRGDPVAEFTRFGWTIMSPGAETDFCNAYLAVNSTTDYERLCALDVLGLQDHPAGNQDEVYKEFKEQLSRLPDGSYETGLPWKGNCPELPNNHDGSVRRLNSLLRKLKRDDLLEEYDSVIREQLEDGVVERVPAEVKGREFYVPHRAVIREDAQTTKMRIVYDASARARDGAPSLNECLHAGPPLNNQLWNVITRQRFHPVAIAGDLRKAFLQVRVRENDRDALRFHWIKGRTSRGVEVLRFTRVLFGLAPSPFLLNGVLQQHLDSLQAKYPASVTEVRRSLYVDDLISGAPTIDKVELLKREAVEIFEDAKFTLHKWNSNIPELETDSCTTPMTNDLSFAKEQLSGSSKGECKLLGLAWDKASDQLGINFPATPAETSKRGILANLAKVYDPLGLVSPVILEGKRLYREACITKLAWDAPLPEDLATKWKKWERKLPDAVSVVRSIPTYQEAIDEIQLHAFGDASGHGVCAAVYAVVTQASGISQGLGPAWLSDPSRWPPELVTEATPQSTDERKVQRELFAVGVEVNNHFDRLLEKFGLHKAMRICAWISRFTHNSRQPSKRTKGPLTTQEILRQEISWIKRAQGQGAKTTKFDHDRDQLNLQLNTDGVLECRGRIQDADAFGKPVAGIRIGALTWLGSYDECVNIPGAYYCLTQISTKTKGVIRWGMCIPKGCTEYDVENGVFDILTALNVKLKPFPDNIDGVTANCAKPSEYTGSVIATLCVFGFILFLCFVGTVLEIAKGCMTPTSKSHSDGMSVNDEKGMSVNDEKFFTSNSHSGGGSSVPIVLVKQNKENIIVEFFLCFSLIRNTARIMDTSVPPGAITSINGMRVLSMFWVILGHTLYIMFLLSGLTSNILTSYKIVQRFSFQAILNASVSVDTFFFLSGLLVAYLSFRHMEKNNGRLNLFQFYFHRFWRLTPAYMGVILFYDQLMGFVGTGPLWFSQQQNPLCDKYWWTNLLYINNFYPTKLIDECLGWSWYLANDMQFYVISPVILFIAYRFRMVGILASIVPLLIASFITTGVLMHHFGFDVNGTLGAPNKPDYQSIIYIKPYCRIAPYLVGMTLGYVLHTMDSNRPTRPGVPQRSIFVPRILSQKYVQTSLLACGWGVAIICTVAPLYGTYSTVRKDNPKPFNKAENILYNTFSRYSWSIGLAWVVFACHIGKGGLVNNILSARFWIPISRLTYMAYLIHIIVMSAIFASTQTLLYYSDVNMAWNFLAALTASYLCAFIVSVTLEIPMMQLEKILFKTHRKKD